MPSTLKAINAISSTAAAALAKLSTTYRYNNTVLLPTLEERLQTALPSPSSTATATLTTYSISPATAAVVDTANEINSSTGLTSISHVASVVVSNFLPLSSTSLSSGNAGADDDDSMSAIDTKVTASTSLSTFATSTSTSPTTLSTASLSSSLTSSTATSTSTATFYPSYSPPVVESLVASSAEEFSNNFRDLSFDIFDDNDNDLFGSPLAFDASENGLWNGRFVPPPPRPPFFVDEPVLSDGLTTCDLCSWAMPTKSTFIFEGTMEKASELGWPLTLTIVSILSAILGAIIMIAVVKCRRKKTSHQRSDTHVQWWSRNKRPNGNNNHLRRSNIYTAHPADSIRGLQQPNSLSASSSMTAMTTAIAAATAAPSNATTSMPYYHHPQQQQQQQQQQLTLQQPQSRHHHVLGNQQYLQQFEHEHEYHQPQELQLQLQPPQQQATHLNYHQHPLGHSHTHHHNPAHSHQQQQHQLQQHQHQHSASMSSSSTNSMPSLSTQPLQMSMQMQMPEQIHLQSAGGVSQPPQHVHIQHKQQQQQQQQHQLQHQHEHDLDLEQPSSLLSSSSDLHDNNMFHWPTATSIVTS